jgi:hypothetical protein
VKKITSGSEVNLMAKKIQKSFSKIQYSTLIILGGLLLLVAVSCQTGATEQVPTQAVAPEDTLEIDEVDSAEPENSSGEDQAQVVESEDLNQCLICHTDQQALQDTADPVVVVESESSGEG